MTPRSLRAALARVPMWVAVAVFGVGLVAAAALVLSGSGTSTDPKPFCDSLRGGSDPVALFAAGASDPSQLTAAIDRMVELQKLAPSEVKPALADLAAVARDVQQVLTARTQPSNGSTAPTVATADADKAAKASGTVSAYAKARCGIDILSPTTTVAGG